MTSCIECSRFWLVIALAVWATAIAVSDIRRFRIPNVQLLLVAIPAVLIQVIEPAGLLDTSVWQAVGGFALGFGVLFAGYLTKTAGAGDVKYAGVVGLVVGLGPMFQIMLIGGLLLGLVSVMVLVESRWTRQKARRIPAGVCISAAFVLNLFGVEIVKGVGHA